MKKILFALLSLVLILMLFAGCATIMTGEKQEISVNSSPDNAKVKIETSDGMPVFEGKTPMLHKLSRKNEYVITVELEGYQEKRVILFQNFNSWTIGNLFCGAFIPGIIIDFVSGAVNQLEPGDVYVTLERVNTSDTGEELQIALYIGEDDGKILRYSDTMIPSLPDSMIE